MMIVLVFNSRWLLRFRFRDQASAGTSVGDLAVGNVRRALMPRIRARQAGHRQSSFAALDDWLLCYDVLPDLILVCMYPATTPPSPGLVGTLGQAKKILYAKAAPLTELSLLQHHHQVSVVRQLILLLDIAGILPAIVFSDK
jgi:hypothetical protein